MTDPNRALSEVPPLIEERRRYEKWLAALENRRDSTPPHVFERVQTDYRERLQQVNERLAAHRHALRDEWTTIQTRLSSVEGEEQTRRDERDELQLRVDVGELSKEDATETLQSLEQTLKQLESERSVLRRSTAALGDLFAGKTPVIQGRLVPSAPQRPLASPAAPADQEPRPSTPGGSFDELAFLSSVIGADGKPIRQTPMVPPQEIPAQAAPTVPSAIEQLREAIEAGDSDHSPMRGVRGSSNFLHQTPANETLLAELAEKSKAAKPDQPKPLATNVPTSPPIVLKSASGEQAKTLKCSECGSMNYATEWYCERCGAELAAL